MDLDIEMGDAADVAHELRLDTLPQADDILQSEQVEEPGEVADDELMITNDDEQTLVPTKINIRGVDTLHTDDIKTYVKLHFGSVDKIEWIDDTSANLVFNNESVVREAITCLSAIEIADVTALTLGESLPAKKWDDRPNVSLQVRIALTSDRKQAGAAVRSRYYLLHPEHDPAQRRKKHYESKYREREGSYSRSTIRRGRISDDDVETFEASMYDDAPRYRPSRRSASPDSLGEMHSTANRGKELFANRGSRGNRSASPRQDCNDHAHMDILDRFSHQNRTVAKSIKSRISSANRSKELFPVKATEKTSRLDQLEESIGSARLRDEDIPKIVSVPQSQDEGFSIRGLANQRGSETSGFAIKGAASANARELFPDKLGIFNAGQELSNSTRSKKRQKAQDLFL